MKLNQYKEKKNYKKLIIVAVAIIFLIGGMILEKTFANFKMQKTFKVMEGNFIYEGSGDVIFAFYKDNQEVTSIPTLEEGYVYEKSECNNKASIEWNSGKWAPLVTNLTTSKTKCDIYFKKGSGSGLYNALENLIDKKEGQLIYDGTDDNNLRFIGADPDNYVSFNNDFYEEDAYRGYEYSYKTSNYKDFKTVEECRASSYNEYCEKVHSAGDSMWRIIGVMNNIEDEFGNTGSHLKIIRDSIGEYSLDSSSESENNGYGVNEWSVSDIQKVLNENYYNKKAGGTCCNGARNAVVTCPKWESIGLNDNSRAMVSKVKWNLGTIQANNKINYMTPSYSYIKERGENNGIICQRDYGNCSDTVERTTNWLGYIGLIYPSDYGYAVGGEQRQTCLNETMINWIDSNYNTICALNDWLFANHPEGTITPCPYYGSGSYMFLFSNRVGYAVMSNVSEIRPTLYLNSNVKIEPNDDPTYGTITNPYKLTV